jgi:hypothetical protein
MSKIRLTARLALITPHNVRSTIVASEHALEVGHRRLGHVREMGWDGARWARHQVGLVEHEIGDWVGQHQLGLELDDGVGRRATQHLAQELIDGARIAGWIAQHVGVGGVELNVGNQAEVLVLVAHDLDELAQSDVLDRNAGVQAGGQAL